jgi:GH15 family glucan-1,4-alpha-glucosidase
MRLFLFILIAVNDYYKQAISTSAHVILGYQQPSGAYPSSPNFLPYKYCWIRDGSFTADAMSRIGEIESAEKFFNWCSEVILQRRNDIYQGRTLNARYTYDGKEPTLDWASYQLDGYGILLWAIKRHSLRHGRSIAKYEEMTSLIQQYLVEHWHEPSYDWWEETLGQHAASLACIAAGLRECNNPEADIIQRAIRFDEQRPDASTLACFVLDTVDEYQFRPVLEIIETRLVSESGGVYRYADDSYYGGGEWPILTALLGWCYLKLGRVEEAHHKQEWCAGLMRENGWLPEQSTAHLLHPQQYDVWLQKWGEPANPLLWSQAMVITLASQFVE